MADIYSFTPKPFIQNLDSDEEEESDPIDKKYALESLLMTGKNSKKRSRKPAKYKTTATSSSSSSSSLSSSSSSFKGIIDLDDSDEEIQKKLPKLDEEDDSVEIMTIESKAKAKASSLLKSFDSTQPVTRNDVVIDFVANSENEIRQLSDVLTRFRQKKSRPEIEDLAILPNETKTNQSIASQYSLPVVRRASERLVLPDSLANLDAFTESKPPTPPPAPIANPIKLNTRLNGKHRGNWKMSKSDPFSKLKEAVRSKYGLDDLATSAIKLISCDGPLGDNDTPDSADLEEEDLIDVKITLTEEQMTQAVTHYENHGKKPNGLARAMTEPLPSSSSSSSATLSATKSVGSNPVAAAAPPPQAPQVTILIPEASSMTGKDIEIAVRVTPQHTLEAIKRGIKPHLTEEEIWFSLYDDSDNVGPTQIPELPISSTVESLIAQVGSGEVTLLVHPESSRTLELTINCKGFEAQDQLIKLIVKPTQPCRKMIEKISSHFGVAQSRCQFTYQGIKLKPTDTYQGKKIPTGAQLIVQKK